MKKRSSYMGDLFLHWKHLTYLMISWQVFKWSFLFNFKFFLTNKYFYLHLTFDTLSYLFINRNIELVYFMVKYFYHKICFFYNLTFNIFINIVVNLNSKYIVLFFILSKEWLSLWLNNCNTCYTFFCIKKQYYYIQLVLNYFVKVNNIFIFQILFCLLRYLIKVSIEKKTRKRKIVLSTK